MKVLVTGGAGFIGSNFVKHLFKNTDHEITVVDALTYAGNIENIPDTIKTSSRYSFWYGDVRNGELMNELISRNDIVVHFAAESHVARSIFDNLIFFETDVIGSQVIANACLKKNIKQLVHISTSEVYGTALELPMTEEHQLKPTTPYAAAKAGADRLMYSYWVTYQLPVVILRPFNNYGPNQHLEKVIPRFITSALLDEPLTIHGKGNNTRDWLYVDDTCEAILNAMSCNTYGQPINLGTGIDTSVKQIAISILNILGKGHSLIKYIGERPGQVERHKASSELALSTLGWQAKTDFVSGLIKTIEWYERNEDWWSRQVWMRHVPIKTREGKVEYH